MADGDKKESAAPSTTVETHVGGNRVASIMMGEPGAEKPEFVESTDDATVSEQSGDNVRVSSKEAPKEEPAGDDEGEGGDAEDEDGDKEQGAEGELEDLGDYDPANEETVRKFDTVYLKEDGTVNMERFSQEWWQNATKAAGNEKDPADVGALNKGTYDYLKDRFGLTTEQIKEIEAGQVARHRLVAASIYEKAGGKERLDAAIAWGRDGGYTKEQQDRFNAVMAGADLQARDDAIDALMARFDKAGGGGGGRRGPSKPRGTSPRTPAKDATSGTSGQPPVEGYKSHGEWHKAFKEARAAGDNAKLAEVRRRLKASSWYKK